MTAKTALCSTSLGKVRILRLDSCHAVVGEADKSTTTVLAALGFGPVEGGDLQCCLCEYPLDARGHSPCNNVGTQLSCGVMDERRPSLIVGTPFIHDPAAADLDLSASPTMAWHESRRRLLTSPRLVEQSAVPAVIRYRQLRDFGKAYLKILYHLKDSKAVNTQLQQCWHPAQLRGRG
eukprot:gene30406-35411_t